MIKTFYKDDDGNFYILYKSNNEIFYDIDFRKNFNFCFAFKKTYIIEGEKFLSMVNLESQGYQILEEYQIAFNKEIQEIVTSKILNSILALRLKNFFIKNQEKDDLNILSSLFKELEETKITRKLTLREKLIKFFCCKK